MIKAKVVNIAKDSIVLSMSSDCATKIKIERSLVSEKSKKEPVILAKIQDVDITCSSEKEVKFSAPNPNCDLTQADCLNITATDAANNVKYAIGVKLVIVRVANVKILT